MKREQIMYFREKVLVLRRFLLNPFHPSISMHILHTVLSTFPKVLARRICFTTKSFLVGDHFFYFHDVNVGFRVDIIRRN